MTAGTILVTGGAGYVGAHICKALAMAGFSPVVVDNLSRGHAAFARWGPLEQVDVRDADSLRRVVRLHRPNGVVHCAALAYVGESMDRPAEYWAVNAGGTLALLNAVTAVAPLPIVLSSSCAVYGVPGSIPIPEDSPRLPISPYGNSKLAAEMMVADFGHAHDLPWIALRYFNVVGADPDGEIGESHDPETHLAPCALLAAAGRLPPLTVRGTDYDTPDGTCLRDYIHVSDLAEAHVAALRHLLAAGPSMALNLGLGRPVSVREVILAAGRVAGRPVPTVDGPRRPGDPAILVADPGRSRAVLGFTPRHTALDATLADAWRWLSTAGTRAP